MDDIISIFSPWRRCWESLSGVVAEDFPRQGDGNLLGINLSGSCAYADRDTARDVVNEGGTISEEKEFS